VVVSGDTRHGHGRLAKTTNYELKECADEEVLAYAHIQNLHINY